MDLQCKFSLGVKSRRIPVLSPRRQPTDQQSEHQMSRVGNTQLRIIILIIIINRLKNKKHIRTFAKHLLSTSAGCCVCRMEVGLRSATTQEETDSKQIT